MESKSRKSYAQACDLNLEYNSSEKCKKSNNTEKTNRKNTTIRNIKTKNSPRRFSQDFILFEPERDGKINFPNDNSFRSFRKIRDGFYRLFDEWKKWHNQTNFQYQKKDEFKFKIKFLENSCNGNLYHFGKLFVSQMIQTCVFGSIEENRNSEQLRSLIDDHKLRKLERRIGLKNSPHSGTSVPFVDKELFFFELILNFNNPTFFKYLKLILIQKIEESNDFVNILETENIQVKCDAFKMRFNTISSTLQLLAKFLGYLEFVSYQIDITETSGPFIDNLISLRNREPCCLDIVYYINNCRKKKQIVLTLPWVIVFLKQMDPLAPHLDFYQCCLSLVLYIIQDLKKEAIICHSSIKIYLLKISEAFIENYKQFLSSQPPKFDYSYSYNKETIALDTLDSLIDENFLRETSLFDQITDSTDQQSKSEKIMAPRRITPMNLKATSYEIEDKANNFITKDINAGFNYYFLDMNPLPLKKICEFVSEKIFNKCSKEVRCFLLNQIKECYNFDKENDENSLVNESDSLIKSKPKLRRYSNLTLNDLNSLKTKCSTFIHSFCFKKISEALNCLIYSEDYSLNVIEIAIQISVNICSGKCCNWIVSYIDNKEFIKDLEAEGKIINHIYTDKTYILYDIRETICQLHINHKEAKSLKELEVLLCEMIEWKKDDMNEDGSNKLIDLSAIDLLIGIILRYSSEFINDCHNIYKIMDYFVKLWTNSDLQYIICPRNMYILSDNSNWLAFEKVIKYLIDVNIYKMSTFINDCEWTHECLQDIEKNERLSNLKQNIL